MIIAITYLVMPLAMANHVWERQKTTSGSLADLETRRQTADVRENFGGKGNCYGHENQGFKLVIKEEDGED